MGTFKNHQKMKKLFLLLMLTFTSLNVYAKWIYVTSGNISNIYVKTDSIKRTASVVRYWYLFDLTEPIMSSPNKFYLSMKVKDEIDCNTEEHRQLSVVSYSENMGKGEIITSETSIQEVNSQIIPDSVQHVLYKFVCNKK